MPPSPAPQGNIPPSALITGQPGQVLGVNGSGVAAWSNAVTGWMNVRSPIFAGGAKLDGQVETDGHMLLASHTLTSASNPFGAADVGKSIKVAGAGAGGIDLVTTISAFGGAGSVTLTAPAATGVAGVQFVWGTDDGPAWQSANNTLAGTGIAAFADYGISVIATPVVGSSYFTVIGNASVTIAQMLTGAGNFAAFNFTPTLGVQTTVTAINVVGTQIIQSATNYAKGQWIYVNDAALLRGNLYQVVRSAAGGGHWNLTLDRPVDWQFQIADVIWPVTTLMQEVRFYCNGMKFTGTSQGSVSGYVGFGGVYRCFIYDAIADSSLGALGNAGVAFNFDVGSLECDFVRCRADGGAVCQIGFAMQSCERCRALNCTSSNMTNDAYAFLDCFDCEIVASDSYGSAVGVGFGSNEVASTVGTTSCRVIRGSHNGNSYAVNYGNGSSYNTVDGCALNYAGISGVQIGNGTGVCLGNAFDNLVIEGCVCASGGAAFYVNGNGHQFQSTNLRIQNTQTYAISISGTGVRAVFNDLAVYDAGLAGGGNGWTFFGASDVTIKAGYFCNTVTLGSYPSMILPQGNATLCLDDVLFELASSSASAGLVAISAQVVCNYRLRNCRTIGVFLRGVNANAGVAVTVRVLEGCNFTSATGPLNFDATAQPNRVTVQAVSSTVPIATAFADLTASEQVKWTRSAAGGVATSGGPLIIPTATVGWTTTFAATDAGTYLEEAE